MGRKLTTIFKVLIAAYLISAVLLAAGAFIMYKMRLGDGQMRIVVMVIYGISSTLRSSDRTAVFCVFIGCVVYYK